MTFQEVYAKVNNLIQMDQAEAQKLYDCASRLPEDAIVVEIGTYQGGSAAIMAAATKGVVFTIDPEMIMTTNLFDQGKFILENVQFIKGRSEDIEWEEGKLIDMLFIDGSHFYVDVHKDIGKWVPKVKDGGFICFHDYGSHTDVTIAINEALMKRIGFANHSLLTIIK